MHPLVETARPRQWVKNLFVATPLVFSKHLNDEGPFLRALAAVAIFCALSSAVYFLNDIVDIDKDRAHPRKKYRPIPSGRLSVATARTTAATLAAGGLALGFVIDPRFALTAAAYLALNIAYSLRLKHVVYVDVACLAAGFLLRVLAGGYAVDVFVSSYLLVCTGLLACFLGLGKRAHERAAVGDGAAHQRPVLRSYRGDVLAWALGLTGVATLGAFVAYTLAPHTVSFFGTTRMVWTAPLAAIGLLRFWWLVRDPSGDSPTDQMLRDVPFMTIFVLWAAAITAIIYLAR